LLLLSLSAIDANSVESELNERDSVIELGTTAGYLGKLKQFDYLIDTEGTLSGDKLQATNYTQPWRHISQYTPSLTADAKTVWVRFPVSNLSDIAVEYLLFFFLPSIDEIEFFQYCNQQLVLHALTGARYSFSSRPVNQRNYSFPVNVEAGQQCQVFVKMISFGKGVPLDVFAIWEKSAYYETTDIDSFLVLSYSVILVTLLFLMRLYTSQSVIRRISSM